MEKIIKYVTMIPSVVAIVATISSGLKLLYNNYEILVEVWIIAVSNLILFVCAIYNVIKNRKQKNPSQQERKTEYLGLKMSD